MNENNSGITLTVWNDRVQQQAEPTATGHAHPQLNCHSTTSSTTRLTEHDTVKMNGEYESVPVLDNDRLQQEEEARRVLLGPFSILVKLSGLDHTYSLFKKETRGKCLSFLCTPVGLVVIIYLIYRAKTIFGLQYESLSYEFGEILTLGFFAVHSVASAIFLFIMTGGLFFGTFYQAYLKASADAHHSVISAEPVKEPPTQHRRVLFTRKRVIVSVVLTVLSLIVTAGVSVKVVFFHGHHAHRDNSTTEPYLKEFMTGEPFSALWAVFLSSLALTVYAFLHLVVVDLLEAFNKDLKESSENEKLAAALPSFSARQISVLSLLRLLSSTVSIYASFSTVTGILANAFVMFISLAYKEDSAGATILLTVGWTVQALGYMIVSMMMPNMAQNQINDTTQTLLFDKNLWKDEKSTALANSMITRNEIGQHKILIVKAFRLGRTAPHFLMLAPPLIGIPLIIAKNLLH